MLLGQGGCPVYHGVLASLASAPFPGHEHWADEELPELSRIWRRPSPGPAFSLPLRSRRLPSVCPLTPSPSAFYTLCLSGIYTLALPVVCVLVALKPVSWAHISSRTPCRPGPTAVSSTAGSFSSKAPASTCLPLHSEPGSSGLLAPGPSPSPTTQQTPQAVPALGPPARPLQPLLCWSLPLTGNCSCQRG